MTSLVKKFAKTSFGDIAYSEQGQGPAALFVHGVFLNGHLWRGVIDRVADLRRCFAIDLMAHGATRIAPDQDVGFTAQAEMLEAFCAALDLDQVDLVANDSGGGIAQIFAARHPRRIRSLTLTNCDAHDNWPPAAFAPTIKAVKEGRLAEIGRRLVSDVSFARAVFAAGYEHPERIAPETFQAYLAPLFADAAATRNLERWFASAHDNRETVAVESKLRRLSAPTLIVWGTADIFFPVKWAYWLRGAIPGVRKVVELEGAKLFFPDERPEELAAALREHWQAGGADNDAAADRASLERLNRDYIRAVQEGDVARFDEILAADFFCSNPDGSLVDRAGFLKQTALPVTISGLAAQDVNIRLMGDFAIIHARTSYRLADGRGAGGRYTDVWARRQGRWLAVSAHVTRG